MIDPTEYYELSLYEEEPVLNEPVMSYRIKQHPIFMCRTLPEILWFIKSHYWHEYVAQEGGALKGKRVLIISKFWGEHHFVVLDIPPFEVEATQNPYAVSACSSPPRLKITQTSLPGLWAY